MLFLSALPRLVARLQRLAHYTVPSVEVRFLLVALAGPIHPLLALNKGNVHSPLPFGPSASLRVAAPQPFSGPPRLRETCPFFCIQTESGKLREFFFPFLSMSSPPLHFQGYPLHVGLLHSNLAVSRSTAILFPAINGRLSAMSLGQTPREPLQKLHFREGTFLKESPLFPPPPFVFLRQECYCVYTSRCFGGRAQP